MGKVKFLIILFITAFYLHAVHGQDVPPTIIQFEAETGSMTFEATENAEAFVTFSWVSVGVDSDMRLQLQTLLSDEWVIIEDELLPSDEMRRVAVHPLDFTVPVYRLLIVDDDENILDDQYLTLPYDVDEDAENPRINAFTTDLESVNRFRLENGTERVTVRWDVIHRTATSHIVFEQVVGEGTQSVELPRRNLWVRSNGEGVVAPLATDDDTITLQIRVYDLVTETVYDAIFLTLPVDETPLPTPTFTPRPTIPPTPIPVIPTLTPTFEAPQIVRFEITPQEANPGDTLTLEWNLVGADAITLYVYDQDDTENASLGPLLGVYEYAGASGSVAYTLPPEVTGQALFSIFTNPEGANASLLVRINP